MKFFRSTTAMTIIKKKIEETAPKPISMLLSRWPTYQATANPAKNNVNMSSEKNIAKVMLALAALDAFSVTVTVPSL